jgi:hemerythrin-like domain-containing protein
MSALLTRLEREHAGLTQVLDLLEVLLNRFNRGDEPDYELMCELLEYIIDYADQVHHPAEELIFDRVAAVGGQEYPVLARLHEQHQGLDQLNRRFRESLEGIIHEAVQRRDEVEQQGRELVGAHRGHMRLEDQEAFPLGRAVLSDADWAALDAQAPTAEDPVFVRDPARFRAILAELQGDDTE